jgi:hypothetical protein
LLNYCGLTREHIRFVVDRNPAKQGMLLPGSRIPVLAPDVIDKDPPDYLLILPWNLTDEVVAQNADFRTRGGRFVTAIPTLKIF